jgi:speckle-type POZ protein
MYHGSLSDAGMADVSSTLAEYQHLLVAADRYGIEELKKICEDILCGGGIMIDSVVSMLEDHGCLKLKTDCFDFLANGENFKIVATSSEYFNLIQSYPSLLVEMRNRFMIAHEE